MQADWILYESEKKQLPPDLTSKEYEEAIKKLVERLVV